MSAHLVATRGGDVAPRLGVLHVALFPRGGVWSHIQELVLWQTQRGLEPRLAVFFGSARHRAAWLAENGAALREMQGAGVACSLDIIAGLCTALKGLSIRFVVGPRIRAAARELVAERHAQRLAIHCHTSFLFGYILPFDAGVSCPTTVVTALHGVHPASARYDRGIRNRLYGALARRCARYSTVVSVDETGAANYARYFGVDPSQIVVIHNGTAIPRPRRPRDGDEPVRFGFIGRLDPRKGWDVLCDAFERGLHAGARWELIVAGTGVDERNAEQRLAALGRHARFLGHVACPSEDFYPLIDVLVLPSEGEGLPMVALEAGARGTPIIASRVGGLPLVVVNGVTGRLVAPSDVEQLTNAMHALEEPRARAEMSREVRAHVEARFSIDSCGARWLEAAYGLDATHA